MKWQRRKFPLRSLSSTTAAPIERPNARSAAGARVVSEPVPGYGRACMAGIRALLPKCDIVVFLDGDGSDCPEFMNQLVDPIVAGTHDFVIGSRTRGQREPGSMNFQQILAGRVAGLVLRLLYGVRYTDMCPFRAIGRDALEKSRYARANLRLESRNADESRARRAAHPRNSSKPSSTRWWGIESFRHIARDICRRHSHYRDALAHRDRKNATDEHGLARMF